MKFWDYPLHKLAYIMTDEMNSAGEGTRAQHQVLAMGWAVGFEMGASLGTEQVQSKLDRILEEDPWAKEVLKELEEK